MSILFVLPNFGAGGAQKQCALLFNEISKVQGIDAYLVCFGGGPNIKWLNTSDNVFIVNSKSLYNIKNIFKIIKIIKNNKIKLVYSWLPTADIYCGVVSVLLRNVGWIVAERDSFYVDAMKIRVRNFLVTIFAKYIIANSESGVEYWASIGVDRKKLIYIGNILAVDDVGDLCRVYDVGCLGRMEMQKNVILSANSMISSCCDSGYFAGSGVLSDSIKDILSKSKSIDFFGYVNNSYEILKKTKVFLTLSFHEGTPNALIEAVSAGCVVVATKIKEHVDILGDDYIFYVNGDDSYECVAEVINAALCYHNSGDYGAMLYAKGVVSGMTPSHICDKFIVAYEKF